MANPIIPDYITVIASHVTAQVEIRTTVYASYGTHVHSYFATTEGTRPAYHSDGSRTQMRCPYGDCDAIPHTRYVTLLAGSSGNDTLILGCCEDGHEFGGFLEDHSGQTSGVWFVFTHMQSDQPLDVFMNDIKTRGGAK